LGGISLGHGGHNSVAVFTGNRGGETLLGGR
jgi:hypothetical protein